MKSNKDIENAIGYTFNNGDLLNLALIHKGSHKSISNSISNERLEFLGDRVLGLVVANLLYQLFPHEEAGGLSQRSAFLVSKDTLAEVANNISLNKYIKNLPQTLNKSISSDACEALIGAVFLDGGYNDSQMVIEKLWTPLIDIQSSPPKHAKSILQELVLSQGLPLPRYTLIDTSGPDHSPTFVIALDILGHNQVTASGPSKRIAENNAAEILLKKLN